MGWFLLGVWMTVLVLAWVYTYTEVTEGDQVSINIWLTIVLIITVFTVGVELGELGVFK